MSRDTLRSLPIPIPIVIFTKDRFGAGGRSRELATRFAKARPVVLLEPPSPAEPGVPDSWDLEFPVRQLLVGRPLIARYSAAAARSRVPAMVRQLLRWQDVDAGDWIAWLEAPDSFPVARQLAPRLVVYDCARPTDPLAGDTSPKEAELVRAADLLFLGGSQRSSWDGLAAQMLRELARAEGARPLRVPEDVCTYVA